MSREQNGNPPQPARDLEPPGRQHDPIQQDSIDSESAPSPAANEPKAGEQSNEGWDWAEHED